MKKDSDSLIDIIVPTGAEFSTIQGRNGTFRITKLRVWESHDHTHIYLDGLGKRQVAIRGGLRVTKECFEEICRRYLNHVRGYVLRKKPESDDDGCRINPEDFCETCQTVHLRERVAAMEVPAGEAADEYHLVECDKSFCPTCGEKAMLLCSDLVTPAFYICWNCRMVAEVGVGPIKKEGATHEV
jgi:hypothetical protein